MRDVLLVQVVQSVHCLIRHTLTLRLRQQIVAVNKLRQISAGHELHKYVQVSIGFLVIEVLNDIVL